jgi:aspartate-semialdehyde dehydrogenase
MKLECAILGATGTVGQRFVQLLDGHPDFEPTVLAASERSAGKLYTEAVKWLLPCSVPSYAEKIGISGLDPAAIASSGARLAFSALPANVAGPVETELARRGVWVFSNAAAHRMDPHVPILVPEVNHPHLGIISGQRTPGKIVTNANCSTTGLVLGLGPLRRFGFDRVVVATYQAVSGAGYPGVASIDILGNVVPHIPREEEKMVAETRRILGSAKGGLIADHPAEVIASCARVPVDNGHLEAVAVGFPEAPDYDELLRAFAAYESPREVRGLCSAPDKPVVLTTAPDRPQPKRDAWLGGEGNRAGMAACVGRLQVSGGWAKFYLLSNNTVRGAAGGSILNAELALRNGSLGGRA